MTVWDVVMLRDELSMLEVRLHEFAGQDVVHVVTEAAVTHRGHPKPLHYAGNAERFAQWNDSIVPVVAGKIDTLPSECFFLRFKTPLRSCMLT